MNLLQKIKDDVLKITHSRMSIAFVVYAIISVISLLVSNIVVVKNFSFFNLSIGGYSITLTSSLIVFPLIYICSDIFSEVYGYHWSRLISWFGFFINILMVAIFEITILLPGNDPEVSNAFSRILGSSFGILAASLIAYMCGDLFNDIIFEHMRRSDKKKTNVSFVKRSLLSSFCGEIIDTGVFLPSLFFLTGQFGTTISSVGQLVAIVLIQGCLKVVLELILSPVTLILVKKTKEFEISVKTKESLGV